MNIPDPKAVGTQESGYLAKQLLAAMQSDVLDVHGSDCGSTKTLEIQLTKRNKNDFTYRYIIEGKKMVELTPDIIDSYVGKVVHMRSPMYCTGNKICNKCAGELNYKLGILNIGLQTSKTANSLLRLGMKKFHISNLKSSQIDVDDMLI